MARGSAPDLSATRRKTALTGGIIMNGKQALSAMVASALLCAIVASAAAEDVVIKVWSRADRSHLKLRRELHRQDIEEKTEDGIVRSREDWRRDGRNYWRASHHP